MRRGRRLASGVRLSDRFFIIFKEEMVSLCKEPGRPLREEDPRLRATDEAEHADSHRGHQRKPPTSQFVDNLRRASLCLRLLLVGGLLMAP